MRRSASLVPERNGLLALAVSIFHWVGSWSGLLIGFPDPSDEITGNLVPAMLSGWLPSFDAGLICFCWFASAALISAHDGACQRCRMPVTSHAPMVLPSGEERGAEKKVAQTFQGEHVLPTFRVPEPQSFLFFTAGGQLPAVR